MTDLPYCYCLCDWVCVRYEMMYNGERERRLRSGEGRDGIWGMDVLLELPQVRVVCFVYGLLCCCGGKGALPRVLQ